MMKRRKGLVHLWYDARHHVQPDELLVIPVGMGCPGRFASCIGMWGTDSIWWGSPQWQIDLLKVLTIPPAMQEQFGYPPLTDRDKARILGRNAARLYGVDIEEKRCEIEGDALSEARAGAKPGLSQRVFGPVGPEQYERLGDYVIWDERENGTRTLMRDDVGQRMEGRAVAPALETTYQVRLADGTRTTCSTL